jgi:hypothetical protein
MEREG